MNDPIDASPTFEPAPVEEMFSVEAPAAPPKAIVLSKQDLTELENIDLKIKNVHLQLQMMQRDIQTALAQKEEIVKQQLAKRVEIQKKYGVDIALVRIAPDGTILPPP